MAAIEHGAGADRIVERIVVWPHRSLSRLGTAALVGVVAIALAAFAMWAAARGAWPIVLYAALALGGFACALRCNHRAARRAQVIELGPGRLRVSEVGAAARARAPAEFDPCWVRVTVPADPLTGNRLVLRQSGRAVTIGEFLSPEERATLAGELKDRIARQTHA